MEVNRFLHILEVSVVQLFTYTKFFREKNRSCDRHNYSLTLQKKPKPRKKTAAEKLTGITIVTESRGQDLMNFTSPNREDRIDLPELVLSEDGDYVKPDNVLVNTAVDFVCKSSDNVDTAIDSAKSTLDNVDRMPACSKETSESMHKISDSVEIPA